MEEKKPWYKLPQLWVLVGFVVLIGLFIAVSSGDKKAMQNVLPNLNL